MPALECPLGADCDKGPDSGIWKTQDVDMEHALILQENHMKYAHQAAAAGAAPAQLKAEKLTRPHIKLKDSQIDEEQWEFFLHKWATYKAQANLTVSAKQHLESCLGEEITEILFGRFITLPKCR